MYLTYDNGGASADRYTVFPYRRWRSCAYLRPMYLALDETPEQPQGFSQWGGWGTPGPHLGKRVPFASLPEHVRAHVLARIKGD